MPAPGQTQVNVLGQSFINPNMFQIFNDPDTDCRVIKYVGNDTVITPNYMHDHTIFEYKSPVGNALPVTFNYPTNTEDRSLHFFTLDNSNNGVAKTFTFLPSYIFLDNLGVQTYTVNPGKKLCFYGAIINGKIYFRVSIETTN